MSVLVVAAMFASILPVKATDWSPVFIEGVNSHHADGKIKFSKGTYLEYAPADGILPAHEVDDEDKACWTSGGRNECIASGVPSSFPDDRNEFNLCESGSNVNVGPPPTNNVPLDIPSGEYADINLSGNNRIIRFSDAGGIYKIKNLTATSGTLEFAPGQYWIENLQINKNVTVRYPSSGTVSWFIKNDYTHKNSSLPYSAEQLLIHNYGNFQLEGKNYLRAYVFSEKDITITGNSSVEGAIAGGANVELGSKSRVIFKDTAASINVTPDCGVTPPAINHYRIEFTTGALSCAAKNILIRACADDNCITETSASSSVNLTKNGSVYSTVNFTGHTVPAAELWHADGGTVLVGLGGTTPSGIYRCFIDGVEVGNAACQLTFEETGFYFDAPDLVSNKNSDQFELFAVTKDTTTQQCVPLFSNQNKSVDFTFNYKDPSPVNNQASLTLTAPTESKVIAGGDTESISVQFDATGKAMLTVNYPEAGEVTLKASHIHTVNTPNGTEELLLEHQDSFVAKPAGFHFFNVSTDRCDSGDPYDANCKVLAKAGDSFDMRMKAVGWRSDGDSDFSDNPALQNFKQTNIQIQAVVEQPSLADDGVNGSFSTSAVDFDLSGSDSSQLISQSWNEVGTVTAKLTQDISYLGVTVSKDNASSEVFGRFTPAYLDISGNSPSLTHSCDTFTYMDQPFGFIGGGEPIIQVKGMVSDGSEASNYQIGHWWRYKHKEETSRNQWSGRSYEDKTGELQAQDSLSPGLSGSVSYASNANTATLTGAEVEYLRLPTPIAPFDAKFDLKLAAADVTDEDNVCYKTDPSGTCQSFSFEDIEDIADGAAFELRYGRLLLENGYGPEAEILRLPLRTEYVVSLDLAGQPIWGTSDLDSCSTYDTHSSADSGEAATLGLNMTFPSGFPEIEVYTDSALSSQVNLLGAGLGYLFFEAPNAAGEVPFKLHVEPWLKWYWNYDGDKPNDLYDPRASAFFGTYRGHDRVIQWREVQ